MKKELIAAPSVAAGLGGRIWSPGLKVGPWLFLSGCAPYDTEKQQTIGRGPGTGTTPGKIDAEAQWRQALNNIEDLVKAAGGTMSDVVMANVFVSDIHFYHEYQWIRQEYFDEPYPVSTVVEVANLVHPDWVVEIEAIAYIEGNEG
ncbi:MAG TPA: RidA family protein [Baekduia sp.]|uniref:RidA family protein n=1 Tax=Baekduia sp. TaxID=2600305 RepID=UPI002D77CF81|nr:RidA family protein [Baekduia sp.]HET6509880.1 RidA family protein [Baekduia sp.]